MSLTIGARLGAYEILAPLGAGGMGEVYRARDTRLDRDVALKILPDAFAKEPGRLARFEREAKTLALMNHPNIAGIYSVEEANGITALAMELVEGEDLSSAIARGAIPVEDALPIARQIADALHAAHEQGVIHRDLKPANIKLRPDGTVKVLDFGLAKALAPEPGDADADTLSQSPTISSPALMPRLRHGNRDAGTDVGVVLGTPAYMAPEQARGKGVGKRADIWAFGCVLYEMLTGARAFDGNDGAARMAAVIKSEPSWKALPPDVPAPIVALLRGCLAKDPRNRIADIGVATFVLAHAEELVDGATATAEAQNATASFQRRRWRRALATAASVGGAALVAALVMWLLTRPAAPSVVKTTITTSGTGALSLQGTDRDVAITPDGSRIVYRGNNVLLVRALNQFAPTVLSGLGAPRSPFVSPNGESVGYFDLNTNTVRTVAITGGPPTTVCAFQGAPRGASWGPDGSIIFATNTPGVGLQRVSAAGGEPTVLTTSVRERGEGDARWPEYLPGGKAVLFTIVPVIGGAENAQIAVLDVGTRTSKVLVQAASHAQYVSTGHLVYGVAGTLRAVAFDLARLEVDRRASATVLEGVVTTAQAAVNAAIAANGSLVYVSGGAMGGGPTRIMSVDRTGRAVPLPGLPLDSYRDVRVSPDGRYLAVATLADVWVYDTEMGVSNRVTVDAARENSPLWTPDGDGIVYTSYQAGYPELYWRLANGTGAATRLLTRAKDLIDLFPNSWSRDGRQLLFTEVSASVRGAIGQVAAERPSEVKILLKDDFNNQFATLSPDGRWLAYTSNRSSRSEIYVDRYPDFGDPHRISSDGGTRPLWSRDARELFFSNNNRQIFVAKVQLGTTFVARRPEPLFEFPMSSNPSSRPYDIGRDGQFYIIRSGQEEADGVTVSGLNLIENWSEELRQRVPVN